MAESPPHQTSVKPIDRPLNLIPVGLKEAALDSPTFRATALHFADQIDVIERWLDGYVKAAGKLVAEVSSMEAMVNSFLAQSMPPASVSEAVLDHDYTMLAMKRYGEGAREFWNGMFRSMRRYDSAVVEPIRSFLNSELRAFKEARRVLDVSQKNFDAVIARYLSQSKTKEASSLREDAFQVHEARKAYLKASMDFGVTAPQLRASLDQLIVSIFTEQWKEMRNSREASAATFTKLTAEMERVRGWSREMENSERAFKRELMVARRQIEESAMNMTKPSRELGDYETSTVPYLGTGAGAVTGMASPGKKTAQQQQDKSEKQGWLFQKSVVGKPARTVWSRRWFFVKNGIFGWLVQGARSGGVEESEKIGVLLCGVRPAFQEERRFCFEVKTNDRSVVLQCETQAELSDWLGAFETAKRGALEDEGLMAAGAGTAFSISPPIAPEFAAKIAGEGEEKRAEEAPAVLGVPEREGTNPANRASFDINAARRVTSLTEREPGEGGKDHAARIIQKLDLHKRSTAAPQMSQSPSTPSGGIASLISASHNILPIRPETPVDTVAIASTAAVAGAPQGTRRTFTIPYSTLAPSTLANPPAPTNLSHTAVVVSGEMNGSGGTTSAGILANLWGSSNWGYVNRLGDDRAKAQPPPPSPQVPKTTVDDMGVIDGTGALQSTEMPPSPFEERKAAATETNLPGQLTTATTRSTLDDSEQYPNYYPLPLKAQNAQFRMLFPSVPRSEKVVLVFRATWNPNEQQEFPGRVYVTTREIYFYSHHLGLVLITGVGLAGVSEVTGAPGRDCDFLYLHLKDGNVGGGDGVRRRITIRVFLDGLRLLQRRLDFLVRNASEEVPASLEEVLKTLIKLEIEKPERSSSVESWEDLANDLPATETSPGRRERNVQASIRIDGSLYASNNAKTGREVQKFQLPRQPVVYAPQGMQTSITREFGVSAKALFHVMFGDKSAVFQLLYSNRYGDKIAQSPWSKQDETHGGQWTRHFSSARAAVTDTQTVDVLNDHLCYVVTNHKVPWRLPYASRFRLTTKLVITHLAKSRAKLAIFQQISWVTPPGLVYVRSLVEKQALNNLEADALDLTNVGMDQVAKLGKYSKTNRAIEIFGNIGQVQSSDPPAALDAAAVPGVSPALSATSARQNKPISLTRLVFADLMVRFLRSISLSLDVLIALGKGVVRACSAHTLLVGLLLASAVWNGWYGYRDGLVWWDERSAARFMGKIGVGPEVGMGRAIYLRDVEVLVAMPQNETNAGFPFLSADEQVGSAKTCRSTFGEQLSVSSAPGSARVQRSRHALARYRHDLLVALRVVNRVERDVIAGEFEAWVKGEERKCERVQAMLQRRRRALERGTKKGGKDEASGEEEVERELGAEFRAYCDSCRSEVKGLESRVDVDGAGLM